MIPSECRQALRLMGNGVFVISAEHDGIRRGFTATWVTQASYEHPLIMASFSKSHDTYPLIVDSHRFTINILAPYQVALARHFGRKKHSSSEDDYLTVGAGGFPVVRGAMAALHCDVVGTMEAEDHTVFLGRVVATLLNEENTPLFYWPKGGFVTNVGQL